MCSGHVGRHLGRERAVAVDRHLAVAGLTVELGQAEHVGEALFRGEALEQAHLGHRAGHQVLEHAALVHVQRAEDEALVVAAGGGRRGDHRLLAWLERAGHHFPHRGVIVERRRLI